MSELLDRLLGFLPHRGTFWSAISFIVFLFLVQHFSDWTTKKTKLPWMEETNQQKRKELENDQG